MASIAVTGEIPVKIVQEKRYLTSLSKLSDLTSFLGDQFGNLTHEVNICVDLDTLEFVVLGHGSCSSVAINALPAIDFCLLREVKRVVFFHNHPSGNPNPSSEDIKAADMLNSRFSDLGILVIDHIILGYPNYFSLKDQKMARYQFSDGQMKTLIEYSVRFNRNIPYLVDGSIKSNNELIPYFKGHKRFVAFVLSGNNNLIEVISHDGDGTTFYEFIKRILLSGAIHVALFIFGDKPSKDEIKAYRMMAYFLSDFGILVDDLYSFSENTGFEMVTNKPKIKVTKKLTIREIWWKGV